MLIYIYTNKINTLPKAGVLSGVECILVYDCFIYKVSPLYLFIVFIRVWKILFKKNNFIAIKK